MKLNDLDRVIIRTARPMHPIQAEPGRGGFVEALTTRLMRAWIRLYAASPRRPLPPL